MHLVVTDSGRSEPGDSRAARLRKLIARKRSEKERLEREMDAAQAEMAKLAAVRRRRLDPVDDEVHEHFWFVLQRSRFSPDERAQILDFYLYLMESSNLSWRPPPGSPDPTSGDHECSCPRCSGELGDDAEPDESGDDRVHVPPRRKSDESTSLRDLYRELATRYHPDKARDEQTRDENERLMREINSAYDAGDLDALAALSQELGFEIAGDGVLEALAAQYERIKAEVRELRRHPLGQLVVETRASKKRGLPLPMIEIEEDIEALAEQLESLAELFRAFRAGDLDIDAFLDEILGEDEEPLDEDALMDAIAALVESVRR